VESNVEVYLPIFVYYEHSMSDSKPTCPLINSMPCS